MSQVVAALIIEDGKILICRRPAHQSQPLLWEFAGGKVEPGETDAQALRRECREELGIEVAVGPLFMELTHAYPEKTIHLRLYHAQITAGTPQLLEHAALAWVPADALDNYPFCPADLPILSRLQQM